MRNNNSVNEKKKMKVIVAPEPSPELLHDQTALFLGGGITDCADWQSSFVKLLANVDGIDYLYNPRRESFPHGDPRQLDVQIRWEHEHLRKATAISFWFPETAVQPIALLELGKWLSPWKAVPKLGSRNAICIEMVKKQLFLGVHPNYPRIRDVYMQTKAESPFQKIVPSLLELVKEIKKWGGAIPQSVVVESEKKKKKKKKKRKQK